MFLLLFIIYFILISTLLTIIFYHPKSSRFNYIDIKNDAKYELNETLKNRFSQKKIPDDIDTIIIGSGMSSLTLGCILSRTGKKVLILEKHYIAGGSMHTFTEKGIEFDVGLHYIGSIKEVKEVIDLLGDHDITLNWHKIGINNGGIYDKISILNENIESSKYLELNDNKDDVIEQIINYYPNHKKEINKFFNIIEDANKCGRFLVLFKLIPIPLAKCIDKIICYFKYPRDIFKCLHYSRSTTKEIIKEIIPSAENGLIKLLTCQYGDIGVTADKSSFIYHAGLTTHYMNGGFYPVGGSNMLVHKMISCIKKFGGQVLVNAPVDEISVSLNNNKLIVDGIYIKNNFIKCNRIVSSIGIQNTNQHLLKNILHNPQIKEFNDKSMMFKPSTSHITLFLGLNGNTKQLNLPDNNHWIINDNKNKSISSFNDDYYNQKYEKNPVMFVSFPSTRNPYWHKISKNKSNCIIIVEADYFDFKKFNNFKSGNRDQEYKEIKQQIAKKILKYFYKFYPNLKNNIDFCIVGTPVTNEYYLNSKDGCSYGLEHDTDRASDYVTLRPETPIKGLYLTGQDITSAGVAGAMFSGIVTSHSILGYGLKEMIFDQNIIKDLQKIY